MPTGDWTGPTGFTAMPITADHSVDVAKFSIGWTWTGAPTSIVGTSNATGTGLFGFLIYKNVSGALALSVDANGATSAKVQYRVVVTNPTSVSSYTLLRLAIELRALSYAATTNGTTTATPLPKVGDEFFSGTFGTITGADNLDACIVRGIQCEQENPRDPGIWLITYTVSPRAPAAYSRPTTGATAAKPNVEEPPWTLGPDISMNFATEDFVLGLGRFVAAKTPTEMEAVLNSGSYAAEFNTESASFEMVANSAGDPLESPPPMKIGTATLQINRAFETSVPANIASNINTAIEQVFTSAVTINGITFPAYTCKLVGATIANKRWKKNADWLPKQLHPLGLTYADIGWIPPGSAASNTTAINYTRNTIPAYVYLSYVEVSISIAQRDLGWGYALIDKGYRDKNKKENSFSGRQTYSNVLEEGLFVDMSTGTTDKKVLRLYQVLKTGTALNAVLTAMLSV